MPQIIASVYEILEKIGSGGGGVIYLGRHLRLDKAIVLKADKRKLSVKLETLRREVDALKNLSHRYIPQVYDFVTDGETVYTVMDYIEGESFDRLLRSGRRFPQKQIVGWACQLLEALCYLHSRPPHGILHGDIKPANIMLRPEGDICLIDYNIALALGEDGAVAVGRSPGYASPEHYGISPYSTSGTSSDSAASGSSGAPTPSASAACSPSDSTASMPPSASPPAPSAMSQPSAASGSPRSPGASAASGLPAAFTPSAASLSPASPPSPSLAPPASAASQASAASGSSSPSAKPRPADETETVNPAETESLAVTETLAAALDPASVDPANIDPANVNPPADPGASGKKIVVLDVRSDIYSLGATLYHLLTGRRPARAAGEVAAISAGECSPPVAAIIRKAMNFNPDLRYQTAEEMLSDFTHLRRNDPRTVKHKRNRRVAGICLTAVFLAGGFTSFVGLKQMEQSQAAYALSEYSANALRGGDAPLAAAYALEAMPETKGIFAPPRIPQAEKALADALGVYDLSEGYKPFKTLTLPGAPLKIALASDGKTAAAVYAYEAAVIDMESAAVTARLPVTRSALADVEFVGDTLIACAGEAGICLYDTAARKVLWSGKPATEIAVSADGDTVAAVFRDESAAAIYSAEGEEKVVISFGDRRQSVAFNDTFANPGDNLLALNRDGSLLAASFDDGSLAVYDLTDGGRATELLLSSEFTRFEGGFSGNYFVFSGTGRETSAFAAVDTRDMTQAGGFVSEGRFGVAADESRIFVSSGNLLVKFNPVDGAQEEVALTGADIRAFDCDARDAVVSTRDNGYAFFDQNAHLLSEYEGDYAWDFVAIGSGFAITGGRDTPVLRILKKESHEAAQVFAYEAAYPHDEARINEARTRVTLFSYNNFRLYDINGKLLREVSVPDPERVYDQEYSGASGNLAVIYKDALRIYSGENGDLALEKTGLKSVFYAPYGVSVLEQDGTLSLIDLDTADTLASAKAQGEFAAFCGEAIDGGFLGDQKILGAALTGGGYIFAASDGIKGAVYEGTGKKRFDIAAPEDSEAFFTDHLVILSPPHGTPAAYDLKAGKKITELEKDAYLTYVTQKGEYIITEYISAEGERFGLILEAAGCQTLAYLPGLAGVVGDSLLFDDGRGKLRQSRVYSIEELIELAKGGERP